MQKTVGNGINGLVAPAPANQPPPPPSDIPGCVDEYVYGNARSSFLKEM